MMSVFAATVTCTAWIVGSVLWVELVRDAYHVLSHRVPFLYRQHVWHHRVFRRDLTFASAEIYCKAQWHNDLPECFPSVRGISATGDRPPISGQPWRELPIQ